MSNYLDVENLIKSRRDTKNFLSKKISKKSISKILEMGVWSPNHRMTEPWTFVPLEKNSPTRKKIANDIEKYVLQNSKNSNKKTTSQSAFKSKEDFENCPYIVYVFSKKGRNKEETLENYASTSISVQNMSLYAWSTGIGIHWSTGKPCKVEGLYSRLNIDQTFILVGCLYMGYIKSKNKLSAKPRASFEEKTIWL